MLVQLRRLPGGIEPHFLSLLMQSLFTWRRSRALSGGMYQYRTIHLLVDVHKPWQSISLPEKKNPFLFSPRVRV